MGGKFLLPMPLPPECRAYVSKSPEGRYFVFVEPAQDWYWRKVKSKFPDWERLAREIDPNVEVVGKCCPEFFSVEALFRWLIRLKYKRDVKSFSALAAKLCSATET